jgi:hypothetical protein
VSSFPRVANSLQAPDAEEFGKVGEKFEPPTLRGIARAHKRATAGVAGILLALIAIALVSDLGSRVTRISDSTPCSVWGSAPQRERDAYAALYVKEHGPLPSGASDAGTIEGVIDDSCTKAYGFDEADTVTVLEAVRKQY